MNIILAIGTVDETIVAKMNEIVREKIEKAQEDPLQQRRDHLKPKDERAPRDVRGVDHHISEGKRLRQEAKQLDKRIEQANRQWARGECHYTYRQWHALLEERERAWNEAIRSTPTTVPLHQRRAATDAAMALASTQGLGGHHIFLF